LRQAGLLAGSLFLSLPSPSPSPLAPPVQLPTVTLPGAPTRFRPRRSPPPDRLNPFFPFFSSPKVTVPTHFVVPAAYLASLLSPPGPFFLFLLAAGPRRASPAFLPIYPERRRLLASAGFPIFLSPPPFSRTLCPAHRGPRTAACGGGRRHGSGTPPAPWLTIRPSSLSFGIRREGLVIYFFFLLLRTRQTRAPRQR